MVHRSRRLDDVDSLRALAHPLRMQLLERLVLHGPATATELAAALDDSPSNCSWHLRKLAEHNFVEEAEGAQGRNRPWQAVSDGLRWDESEATSGEASQAAGMLTELLLERALQRLRASRLAEPRQRKEWQGVGDVVQSTLWLTAEEARGIGDQLRALLMTGMERARDPQLRPPGARLVSTLGWIAPEPPEPEPTEPEATGPEPTEPATRRNPAETSTSRDPEGDRS
jgi:hypothetical protein